MDSVKCMTRVLVCIIAITIFSSCKSENKSADSVEIENVTQALILTQPFDYDADDKNKVTGKYITNTKITIPKNLASQNKWIMFEGPVLENDKVAYRYYADSRHRFDIYGKKVSDLVMDTVSWKYHDLMNWGSDILKVGNSLGLGSPAILFQDSIYAFESWDKKEIEILNSGGNSSAIRTTFYGLSIAGQKMTIQQDWTIAKGDYHSTISLKRLDGKLPTTMQFATGIVKHLDEINTEKSETVYTSYNWGIQSYHKQNLGMAIIADNEYKPRPHADKLSHITAFANSENGVTYQFASIWAEGIGNIDNEVKFKSALEKIKGK